MATKFCCCGSNLNAAKILAAIFIIIRIITVGLAAFIVSNVDFINDNLVSSDDVDVQDIIDKVEVIMKVTLAFNVIFLAVDIGLLVGSIKKIAILLWVWIGFAACSVIWMVVQGILVFNVVTIIGTVIFVLVSLWTIAAVYGAVQEIKEEKQ